jgi:hypothetical protein
VKVVSGRLGRANATITLTVYQHLHPGMRRQAADQYAALLKRLTSPATYHRGITKPFRGQT